MLMMMHRTGANLDDDLLPTIHHHHDYQEQSIIINSTCQISWKLYDNPIFSSATNTSISPLKLKPKQLQRKYSASAKFVHHHIHSDHKMITNNNTVSSPKSNTSSSDNVGYHHHHHHHQLNQAKIQVAELRAELEMERKLRKKMEALNKKLSKELVDQAQHQKERVVGVCDCEDLMKEISRLKEETEKMKKEMEEERKMLRMAEVLREERVQMKLADAHMFYHHNVLNQFLLQQEKNPTSIEESKNKFTSSSSSDQQKCLNVTTAAAAAASGCISGKNVIRKASPEPENPHIKQGIKGFVEFQRAIKAKNGCNHPSNNYSSGNSSKQSKDNIGGFNKVECQKAQLRVLFKQKYPLPYSHHDHLIIS